MKIAWFTPYSLQSSIGRRSAEILAELSKFAEIDLWHPETSDERPSSVTRRRFRSASDVPSSALAHYDLVVYNMGNYLKFHGDIFDIAMRVPGVIILHDFVMHHFFAGRYFDELHDPAAYLHAMERLYSKKGRDAAQASVSGIGRHVWETDSVVDFPMFEDTLAGAYGVIVHSDFLAGKVRAVFDGPVEKIHLCCELPVRDAVQTRKQLRVPADDVLIVTVGHVNPNKRVDSVLRALGSLHSSVPSFTYIVLGPYDSSYYGKLREIVEAYGLEKSVRFLGYASDEILHSYLTAADLCVNLRFPAFEGSSGSIVEEMLYGKAVVVSNTGFYAELPDQAVHKISPANEQEELANALSTLIRDPVKRSELAAQALTFAQTNFHPRRYADALLKFAAQVEGVKPTLRFADRLAAELLGLGVTADMEEAVSLSDRGHTLFFET